MSADKRTPGDRGRAKRPKLTMFDLTDNRFSGEIPPEMGSL